MVQIRVIQNKKSCTTKKKGLEEHYQLLIDLTPCDHKLTSLSDHLSLVSGIPSADDPFYGCLIGRSNADIHTLQLEL
jgi:hypothetical protein